MRSAQPVEGGRAMTTVEAAANLQLPGGKVLEITRGSRVLCVQQACRLWTN
jgi:hypothetical protein